MDLKELSLHIFWDVDVNKLDCDRDRQFIIHRVVEYGLLSDWKMIKKYYGVSLIAKEAVTFKNLDKKSVAFISLLSNIPREKFLCYTTEQSTPKHWNF